MANTDRIYQCPIACPPCNGDCRQSRDCPAYHPAEACTELGADPIVATDGDLAAAGFMLCVGSGIAVVAFAFHLYSLFFG